MKRWIVPVLAVLAIAGFAFTVWGVFETTPLQVSIAADPLNPQRGVPSPASLFFNQKIFYYHVANAFMLFMAVFTCGVCSVGYLARRKPAWDDVALAGAEVAVLFGAVVLVTGSIWAKAAWDLWWVWEKRLTMSLLLWLILVGYVLVRKFAGPSADRVAAGMAIFGMVGVPFIYTMVGQDSHPNSGLNGTVFTLGARLIPPFLASMITFFLWFAALVTARVQSTRDEREIRELREQGLDLGVLQ